MSSPVQQRFTREGQYISIEIFSQPGDRFAMTVEQNATIPHGQTKVETHNGLVEAKRNQRRQYGQNPWTVSLSALSLVKHALTQIDAITAVVDTYKKQYCVRFGWTCIYICKRKPWAPSNANPHSKKCHESFLARVHKTWNKHPASFLNSLQTHSTTSQKAFLNRRIIWEIN